MKEHEAVINLRENQFQLDADGCMVGVSRQALEEALERIAEQDAEIADLRKQLEDTSTKLVADIEDNEILRDQLARMPMSLLREAGQLPQGCYCKPGRCTAPNPSWCRDTNKRDAPEQETQG